MRAESRASNREDLCYTFPRIAENLLEQASPPPSVPGAGAVGGLVPLGSREGAVFSRQTLKLAALINK